MIGKHTYGHQQIKIKKWNIRDGNLHIGNFCSISDCITVYLGGNQRVEWISTYPFSTFNKQWNKADPKRFDAVSKGSVIIKSDVWLGSGCTIMSGVTIGEGAVVAANSVVTKTVPPYAIVAGNPAQIKKYRFNPEQIDALLQIKWWDWDDVKINDNVHLLTSGKIDDFIKAHRS